MQVQKVIPHAKLPKRSTHGAIGYDIMSSHDTVLKPNTITKIHTGIAMAIPNGIYLRLAPRSSLSLKGISVEAGVIDNDYRGEIVAILRNNTNKDLCIKEGQKVVQGIFEEAKTPCLVLTESLSNTLRGKQKFGSTDIPTYHKFNKEEAIACALRAAIET